MKTPRRYKLNDQRRGWMEDMAIDARCLRGDLPRRLRNALIALAGLDPSWIVWVEREIPPHAPHGIPPTLSTPTAWGAWRESVRIIETRARLLLLKRFHYLGFQEIGHLVCADWPFNDDASLTPS